MLDPAAELAASASHRPTGIPGSELPGPWAVGEYAAALRDRLRDFVRVQVFGEVVNLRVHRVRVYFELRDSRGALPCSMWRGDWDALGLTATVLTDGARVVAAGGCDFYPGSATSSPSFSFAVSDLRLAGEGDLLAQLQRLRRRLADDGSFEPQKRLRRPSLPRTIGVICGEGSKARDDVLAGLRRRGWAGRVVWAFAPVQDRHAAPRITRALGDLAAIDDVEVILVARGGGSLVDLLAFCDETLCRTVALLGTPVIASVGHHTDRTLLDDVAAVSCSTPTHAAEAAVRIHVAEARSRLTTDAQRLSLRGRAAVLDRARVLRGLTRAPAEQIDRHRRRLHQRVRELRASARRGLDGEGARRRRELLVLSRKAEVGRASAQRGADQTTRAAGTLSRAARVSSRRRSQELERLALALAAHEPESALRRGYALVSAPGGEPLSSAPAARRARELSVRFADGTVETEVRG